MKEVPEKGRRSYSLGWKAATSILHWENQPWESSMTNQGRQDVDAEEDNE